MNSMERLKIYVQKWFTATTDLEYSRYWYYFNGFTCIDLINKEMKINRIWHPNELVVNTYFGSFIKKTYSIHYYSYVKHKDEYYKNVIRKAIYKHIVKKTIKNMKNTIFETLKDNAEYKVLPYEIVRGISNRKLQLILVENGIYENMEKLFTTTKHMSRYPSINYNECYENRKIKFLEFIESIFMDC